MTSSLSGESFNSGFKFSSIAVTARSKALVFGRSLPGVAGSSRAEGVDVYVSCKFCLPLGRGLCDGPITRREEWYREWCA